MFILSGSEDSGNCNFVSCWTIIGTVTFFDDGNDDSDKLHGIGKGDDSFCGWFDWIGWLNFWLHFRVLNTTFLFNVVLYLVMSARIQLYTYWNDKTFEITHILNDFIQKLVCHMCDTRDYIYIIFNNFRVRPCRCPVLFKRCRVSSVLIAKQAS